MVKPYKELLTKIPLDVQARAHAKTLEFLSGMSLTELRTNFGINQNTLAKSLNMAQPNISKLENRKDFLVSTLDSYISALGGKLELHAKFPDGKDIKVDIS